MFKTRRSFCRICASEDAAKVLPQVLPGLPVNQKRSTFFSGVCAVSPASFSA